MKPQDIQKRFEELNNSYRFINDTHWQNYKRLDVQYRDLLERISKLECLVRSIKTAVKSVSAITVLVLAVIGIASLLSGCGTGINGTQRVEVTGGTTHRVLFGIDTAACDPFLGDEAGYRDCLEDVRKLSDKIAKKLAEQEDGR